MERRNLYFMFIYFSLVQEISSTKRIFTCGLIDRDVEEFEAILNAVVNKMSSFSNVSIALRKYNISENNNLYHQASALLQHNVIALIDRSHSKTSACALSTVTSIPLIHIHGNGGFHGRCEKAIQMSAGYKDYAHATLDILNTFGWENVLIVVDDESLHEAGYFRALSRASKLTVDLVKLSRPNKNEDSRAPVLRTMEEIKMSTAEVLLLYVNDESMEVILSQTPCPHKDKINYKWILQREVSMNLSSHPFNTVLAMKLPYVQSPASEELENSLRIYNDANKDRLAVAHDVFQVITQAVNKENCLSIDGSSTYPEDKTAVFNCMREVTTDGLTGPIYFDENGKRTKINLEILNLRNNSFKTVGTWNLTKKAIIFGNMSQNMENPAARESLEGRKFRVVVAETTPFVIRRKEEDGGVSYQGYCIDLLNELAKNLKFTYEIYPSPDGLYGAETDNGTWDGIIGELLNEHADIAVADLTITERREKVVDFTVPYMYYTEEMLLKKTSSSGTVDLLQFMSPFDSLVWFATLASLVLISVAVFVINYYSPYGYKDDNGRGTSQEFSFFNSVWFALACMLQQGADNSPRSFSGRILAGCYWFTILISVSTYTANLAAFFTVKNAESPINNLEDIVKSSYQVGVVRSSSTYEAFKTSKYDTYKTIWHRIQSANTVVQGYSQGTQFVRDRDEFVFIADGPGLRHLANQPPCDLSVVPGLTTAKGLSLALQSNDLHTTDFTLAILHLHENYFLDSLKRKWWDTGNVCPEEQETTLSRKRIGLRSMLGVYIVLAVGLVVAFLTLIAEIAWSRKGKQINLLKNTTRPKINSVQVRSR